MGITPIGVAGPWGMGKGNGAPVAVPPQVAEQLRQQAASRVLALPLPEVFMIPDGRGFNPLGSKATAAVERNIAIPGATVDIPDASLAVVASVTLYITDMVAGTNVTWTVLVNNNPVAGYQGLTIFPRVAPFVGNTFDIPIRVTGPATISVQYTNTDGGVYTVGAALSGWLWPVASDQRWKAGGL